ncbi:carboxypeptidase-like regulatory domain-containing protein [Hymenobacter ginkgonis]|nr:carboxypeptidase-like regulatory domain-containing protein [Hymenobacter ginkgonis]
MALSTNPFHPITAELLPGYRDAYLRGDLSSKNTELVDAYFKANPAKGTEAFERFHALQSKGHAVQPVGWLQQQFHLVRTEPARFRQRAGSLLVVGALLSGAAFAGSRSVINPTTAKLVAPAVEAVATAEIAPEAMVASKMMTVKGRILDENGHPLVGATVLDKNNGRGASTDATGKYTLVVPASQALQLQFGYGGYSEEEVQVKGQGVHNVTLLPRTDIKKKHHWWPF